MQAPKHSAQQCAVGECVFAKDAPELRRGRSTIVRFVPPSLTHPPTQDVTTRAMDQVAPWVFEKGHWQVAPGKFEPIWIRTQ